ncbi:hypothetical protein NUW54_g9457 [Trametes sanguinea]|uniref:Uncharacterized protein n=1 Tax=Trametes sanguinea TaxID=158606 RepID=A0ACC1P6Y3_9APHY|nr:hypothetical protein NUW54_g9457 [Trametes sanguinea]
MHLVLTSVHRRWARTADSLERVVSAFGLTAKSPTLNMLFNFKTVLFTAVTLLFAGQAAASALIATDPERSQLTLAVSTVSACNCPNNCSYKAGHSCKYKAGPSTSSSTVDGRCTEVSGTLTCVPK